MTAITPGIATTMEAAVPAERHRAVRAALDLILDGHRHLAYLELCASVAHQARMDGIRIPDHPTTERNP